MMAGGGITTCGPAKTLPFWPDIRCTCPPPKSLYLVTMSPTTHRPSICLLTRRFVNALPHLVSVQRIDRTAFKDTFFFPPVCLSSLASPVCSEHCGSNRIQQTESCRLFQGSTRASVRFQHFLISSTRGLSAAWTFICAHDRGRWG